MYWQNSAIILNHAENCPSRDMSKNEARQSSLAMKFAAMEHTLLRYYKKSKDPV